MTKLTLYIDDSLVSKIKKYAKQNGTSVSKMVTNYFMSLGKKYVINNEDDDGIAPSVREMMGIIPDTGATDREIRESYHKHIRKKGEK
jgi:nucleoside diphosphate kinase